MESECMCKPLVKVLMSTYNGEKYLKEQLDSILSQTYSNVEIYVRDDGSTDDTVKILKEYEQSGQIFLQIGKNMGYIESFFQLLEYCGESEYYAWCDQDDVWLPGKIQRAVEVLEKDKEKCPDDRVEIRPVLYFSDYDYYDENMRFEKHGLIHRRGPSFSNSLMDCISLGFNSVFNHRARNMMIEKHPKHCCGHDWWTYMICAAFGKVIYDRGYCSVKYRRCDNSVSPGGKSFFKMQLWRFKKFFINDYFAKIRNQLLEFSEMYLEQLTADKKKVMQLFSYKRYSFFRAVKKAFYPVLFRQGMIEEIMVRILFLTGRL